MNETNAVPSDAVDSILHVVPPSLRPWIVVLVTLGPTLTRFGYALYAGRGIVGAIHGILFGTNQAKADAPLTTPTTTTATGVKLMLFLMLMGFSVQAQTIIYSQNFETGLKPPGFTTWNFLGSFPNTWDFQPAIHGKFSAAIQEDVPGFDIGAFCALPQALNNLTVTFSFRCSDFPDDYGLEVIDLYDAQGNEVFDVYLNPSGQLSFTVGGSIASIGKPIQANRTVTISLHLSNATLPATATLTWSQQNGPLGGEINGAFRNDGQSTAPISQLLFGPVESPIVFVYDDLVVTTP